MVENSREAVFTEATRPVGVPEPVHIEEDNSGHPVAIFLKRRLAVKEVRDCWRIDDEWWHSDMISRMYYSVILANGRPAVLYKNLINGRWYRQY